MEHSLQVEYRSPDDLTPYARNARTHSAEQVAQIAGSIREFGFTNPILCDEYGTIIAGHGRLAAAQKLGLEKVPCITLRGLTDTQRRALILADNRLAETAGWDAEMLRVELEELTEMGQDLELIGFDEESLDELIGGLEDAPLRDYEGAGGTAAKFIVPPFSVLDARSGYWNERKRAWREKISDTSETRENAITYSTKVTIAKNDGTSIFDPVLAECLCRWFLPHDGARICDPFAGGGGLRASSSAAWAPLYGHRDTARAGGFEQQEHRRRRALHMRQRGEHRGALGARNAGHGFFVPAVFQSGEIQRPAERREQSRLGRLLPNPARGDTRRAIMPEAEQVCSVRNE